ncbi:MAG: septum formation initiator family protein [Clostridiaceae bacterium]|nr:septum formation initiator family protein [Clostridia bacterium]MDY3871285.1 septum formation initiator family protein [Clostridiaceae bacterium]
MSRYNDSSAVKLERFPVERVQGQEDQQLEVLENRRAGRARPAAVPYGKYAVILACVFAVALGIVASYMRLAAVNLENARLRQQITELKSDENALNAKKEQLYNLAYVEDYARNVLGMVKLDKSQVHYVEMDSGDRMVLAEASVSGGGEQGASLLDRLAKTFSTVLEYLN